MRFRSWWRHQNRNTRALAPYVPIRCARPKNYIEPPKRWLPTVLTVCTSEEGRRMQNELFVSALGLRSCHLQWRLATHLGFLFHSYEYIADCLPWQQTIVKMTIFLSISHLFVSFSRVSFGKTSWNSAVSWKRFRKKWKSYLEDSQKSYNFLFLI